MTSPDHPLSPESAPKMGGLADFSLEKSENTGKFDLNRMNQAELLSLHSKIEAKLTGIQLKDLNLERETMIQFQKAKVLQDDANKDKMTPVNQRAQVQNSIRNTLESLAKMQMELHNSESIKRLKAAVIKVVKVQPKEFQDKFFELLEGELAAAEQEQRVTGVADEPEQEEAEIE